MTPTCVTLFDSSIDISHIHSSTEEEKNTVERFIDESENEQINSFDSDLNGFHKKLVIENPALFWDSIYFKINSQSPEIS